MRELDYLSTVAGRDPGDGGPTVAVLSGMSGVGKTAIAMQWAHAHRNRFSGGQLYADLEDYRHRGGVDVSDILAGFLRALGVHGDYVPAELAERAALFRTRTASAPLLIVLDNVDQAAEVRPLLPGSSGSAVLVASRRRLSGLLVDGAQLIEMSPLNVAESSALVVSMLADSRDGVDESSLRELAELCAGLPIALRVAGARLTARRRWPISRLVTYLSDESHRLGRLTAPGERKVETVLDAMYAALPGSVRYVYCCLGVHPGREFSADVVTAITGDGDTAEESLGALIEANLVEELGEDRYHCHDLVLLHARQRANGDLAPEERDAVLRRIVDWYLLGATVADRHVLGLARWRLFSPEVGRWPIDFTPATAMDWLEAERANLLVSIRAADRHEWYDVVWQFCEALWALYHSRKHYADWIETHQLGVHAAVLTGNQAAEARVRYQLARAYQELGEFDRAIAELHLADEVAAASGERRVAAAVLESFGLVARDQGQFPQAIDRFEQARKINADMGNQRGVALQEYQLGDALVRDKRAEEAVPLLKSALAILDDLGDEMFQARVRIALGKAYQALGKDAEALRALRFAATITRERQQPLKEAQALEALVEVADREEDEQLSVSSVRRLLQIYLASGNPRSADMRRWLRRRGLSETTSP